MTRGTIKVKLRPIKLAFLVHPNDKESLLKAIEINTFLWGGTYNPIIPTCNCIPPNREGLPSNNPSAQNVISGYLDNFDPDYVVPMGECVDYDLDIGHWEKIDNASQILGTTERYGITSYGISIFEILNYFFEQELKFQRRYPLDICIPHFEDRFPLFLTGVFGRLPKNFDATFWEKFAEPLKARKVDCSASNYAEFLISQKLFLRHITSLYLEAEGHPVPCIFYLDATKPLDVMDYWNLRAIGWNVFPIPKQFVQLDKTRQLAQNFIETYQHPITSPITIQKSRSISEDEHQQLADSLDISRSDAFRKNPVIWQTRYPRMWDRWARARDHVGCREFEADTTEHDISVNEEEIRFRTLDPKFTLRGRLPFPRFANEIKLEFDKGNTLLAEVIPKGGWELTTDLGISQIREWRVSRKGLVYLARHSRSRISLPIPQAEIVFTRWFESKGWTVELSPPGRIAKQMIQQLGGIDEIRILAQEGLLQLLRDMNRSDQKSIAEEHVRSKVHKIANQAKYKREGEAERIIQRWIDANVLQLGMEIQCPVCTKHSWYSVKTVDYQLRCPQCLREIPFPPNAKRVKWVYRTIGPFSLPNQADGAYTVLLALRFFSHLPLPGRATTPLMSFTAEKEGMKPLEVDLALFFQDRGLINSGYELIFAECKTFNNFQKKDVERMMDLGKAFPDAVLVFSTLKESLNDEEKKILLPIVNASRKKRSNGNPFNPVLILTSTELFWQSSLLEWREKLRQKIEPIRHPEGPLTELLLHCDLTQQVYLNVEPWDQQ